MSFWQQFLRKKRLERELEKEIRFHLDQHVAELITAGKDPAEARRQARLDLGGIEQVKENCRDARSTQWFDNLILDLTYACRVYRRFPGFALTAIATIALSIGVTTAIFSLTDRILFRPLPYYKGQQLVSLGMLAKVVDYGEFLFAADYRSLLEQHHRSPLSPHGPA